VCIRADIDDAPPHQLARQLLPISRKCFPMAVESTSIYQIRSRTASMTDQRTEQTRDTAKRAATYLWWQRGIIYQVYPRSFMDSNGDGVGDLTGLISRLDYLRWLGVDAVWISPLYPSPMKDFGYDVVYYTALHPLFGAFADFDRLIREAHARDL